MPRQYRIKDTARRPSIRRLSALLNRHGFHAETYGIYCDLGHDISGVTWLTPDRSHSVAMDFRKNTRTGITSALVTIRR